MTTAVAEHYTQGQLLSKIEAGLRALGKEPEGANVEDLGPVDEFHIGGRSATEGFLSQLSLKTDAEVVDIGSGLGGTARFAYERFGWRVSGIDLTPEFVDVARALSSWVGASEALSFHCGSALEMPFEDEGFDAAIQLHVGMNIADKHALFQEVRRVLRPGGLYGIYDVMKIDDAPLTFPVPWATGPSESALATPETYRDTLEGSGFEILSQRDRSAMAREFFDALRARAAQAPPPLGLHLVMGPETPTKIANMVANLEAGRIAPVEIIARRDRGADRHQTGP